MSNEDKEALMNCSAIEEMAVALKVVLTRRTNADVHVSIGDDGCRHDFQIHVWGGIEMLELLYFNDGVSARHNRRMLQQAEELLNELGFCYRRFYMQDKNEFHGGRGYIEVYANPYAMLCVPLMNGCSMDEWESNMISTATFFGSRRKVA